MKSVGIKNLKNNLSAYLKLVKKGEVIVVTERDEVIAEIKKPDVTPEQSISKFEKFLQEEARLGRLTLPKQTKTLLKKNIGKPKLKMSDWWPMYEEIRSDRF